MPIKICFKQNNILNNICIGINENDDVKFNLEISTHPIKDKIFYWKDVDFFNYSPYSEFKLLLSLLLTILLL